ncbi:MAG: hypothetical protein U1C71_00490 [archaeon]|nr:hypothetical protein [archaeon]
MKIPRIVFLRADLKETNIQLRRIADSLEAFAKASGLLGIQDRSEEDVGVTYPSYESLLKQELNEEEEGQ